MEVFPLGYIFTKRDISADDYSNMVELAKQAGLQFVGRWSKPTGIVDIAYQGNQYRTSCRHGEIRFKRVPISKQTNRKTKGDTK